MKTQSLNKEIEDTVKEPKYVRQKAYTTECKKKIDTSTIIVGEVNTLFSTIEKMRQKIRKDIKEINSNINKQDIINIYQTH